MGPPTRRPGRAGLTGRGMAEAGRQGPRKPAGSIEQERQRAGGRAQPGAAPGLFTRGPGEAPADSRVGSTPRSVADSSACCLPAGLTPSPV